MKDNTLSAMRDLLGSTMAERDKFSRALEERTSERDEMKAAHALLLIERDALRAELDIVKRGEPNHPDRAYALKGWLKTYGFKVYCALKHGEVGFVLSLLQAGDISRGRAAEAIAELLVGSEPQLPELVDDVYGEDELPRDVVTVLRASNARLREALESVAEDVCSYLCPSTWKTGHKPPHSEKCRNLTAALSTSEKGGRG